MDVLANSAINLYFILLCFIPETSKFIGTMKKQTTLEVSIMGLVEQSNVLRSNNRESIANVAKNILNVKVAYLDKSEIASHGLSDAMYIHGTLKVHHVVRSTNDKLDFLPKSSLSIKSRKTCKYSISAKWGLFIVG